MSEIFLRKAGDGLFPADEFAEDEVGKIRRGDVVLCTFTRPRNVMFHRKFFALLRFGFEHWQPNLRHGGAQVEKSFSQFRREVTIQAGYFRQVFTIGGNFTLEPESISFSSMSEGKFESLYTNAIDVILKILPCTYSEKELRAVIDEIVGFS